MFILSGWLVMCSESDSVSASARGSFFCSKLSLRSREVEIMCLASEQHVYAFLQESLVLSSEDPSTRSS